jgi:hypothetical protein
VGVTGLVTHCRQMMLEELQRRNFAPTTISTYLHTVEQFARRFNCRPDRLNHTHFRSYQVYLLHERKMRPLTVLSSANTPSARRSGAGRRAVWQAGDDASGGGILSPCRAPDADGPSRFAASCWMSSPLPAWRWRLAPSWRQRTCSCAKSWLFTKSAAASRNGRIRPREWSSSRSHACWTGASS